MGDFDENAQTLNFSDAKATLESQMSVILSICLTNGPVCLMKMTRKRKLIRTHGFILDFFLQLIPNTGC